MLNSDLSSAAAQGGREPATEKPVWCPLAGGSRQTGSPAGHCNHPLSRTSQNSLVPSDFLVDGQVSGLGTMHPPLTLSFFGTWILPLHVVSCYQRWRGSRRHPYGLTPRKTYIGILSSYLYSMALPV